MRDARARATSRTATSSSVPATDRGSRLARAAARDAGADRDPRPAEARRVHLEESLRASPLVDGYRGPDRRRRLGRRRAGDPARAPRCPSARSSCSRRSGGSASSSSGGGGFPNARVVCGPRGGAGDGLVRRRRSRRRSRRRRSRSSGACRSSRPGGAAVLCVGAERGARRGRRGRRAARRRRAARSTAGPRSSCRSSRRRRPGFPRRPGVARKRPLA